MSLLKILLWGIVLYYLYKFVFGVVVPVGKATNQMKSKIKEMQDEQVRQQQTAQQQHFTPQEQQQKTTSTQEGDYIEFEEIK
jgi:Sec-independent protein translocase protein TatA